MPIAVTCPNCAASFKVKDQYAGKRAKCPKCSDPLIIPAGVSPAPAPRPTAAARRVAGPQFVEDDEDNRPKPKRRRDEGEPEQKPRTNKRWEEDDEQDRPAKKRSGKRRGETASNKKGLPLPLVLGVIGGVVLIGGAVGVVAVMSLTADQAKAQPTAAGPFTQGPVPPGGNPRPAPVMPGPVTPGPSTRPNQPEPLPAPVATLTPAELDKQRSTYEGKYITLKTQFVGEWKEE